jgi:hypothetical protein
MTISLNVGNVTTIKLTEAVPDVEFGADLNDEVYPGFFGTKTIQVTNGTVTITLGENPVFVEGTSKEFPSPIYVSIVTHTEEPSPGPILLMMKLLRFLVSEVTKTHGND